MSPDRKQMIEADRKTKREAMPIEHRSAVALEQIADTLEDLRAQFAGVAHVLGAISTSMPPRKP
jgi:hypothetical protein